MKQTNFFMQVRSVFPSLALLLMAVIPVVESIDWMYYINIVLILMLFALWLILAAWSCRINKKQFLKYLYDGSLKESLLDVAISIVGLQISYSTASEWGSFWWLMLAVTVCSFIASLFDNNKIRNEK